MGERSEKNNKPKVSPGRIILLTREIEGPFPDHVFQKEKFSRSTKTLVLFFPLENCKTFHSRVWRHFFFLFATKFRICRLHLAMTRRIRQEEKKSTGNRHRLVLLLLSSGGSGKKISFPFRSVRASRPRWLFKV